MQFPSVSQAVHSFPKGSSANALRGTAMAALKWMLFVSIMLLTTKLIGSCKPSPQKSKAVGGHRIITPHVEALSDLQPVPRSWTLLVRSSRPHVPRPLSEPVGIKLRGFRRKPRIWDSSAKFISGCATSWSWDLAQYNSSSLLVTCFLFNSTSHKSKKIGEKTRKGFSCF